jgi:hypothetical protein
MSDRRSRLEQHEGGWQGPRFQRSSSDDDTQRFQQQFGNFRRSEDSHHQFNESSRPTQGFGTSQHDTFHRPPPSYDKSQAQYEQDDDFIDDQDFNDDADDVEVLNGLNTETIRRFRLPPDYNPYDFPVTWDIHLQAPEPEIFRHQREGYSRDSFVIVIRYLRPYSSDLRFIKREIQ